MGMPVDMMFNKDGVAGPRCRDPSRASTASTATRSADFVRTPCRKSSASKFPEGKKSGDSFNMTLGQLGETQAKIL